MVVEGTGRGAVTDENGEYTIADVPAGTYTVRASFVGYADAVKEGVEVNGGETTTVDFSMEAEAASLEEVVVTGFSTQQRRGDLTEAVSTVDNEELLKSPSSSVGNALAGKAPGLQITQRSGQPGETDPNVRVRGISSLSSGRSQPLYVIDGTIVRDGRSLMQLDANNIESVSVLKDADATAVYGVEGANGVIVVKTKRGQQGDMNISVNSSMGVRAPTHQQEFVGSYKYAKLYNEMQRNSGVPESELRFSDEAIEAFRTGSQPLIYPNIDWVDYLTKSSALQARTNISVSGGTKDVRYFLAGGYLRQDGLFRTFDSDVDFNPSYDRFNFRANLDFDVTPTTTLSLTSGGRTGSRVRTRAGRTWRGIYRTPPWSGAGIVDGKLVTSSTRYIPGGGVIRALPRFYKNGYHQEIRTALNLNLSGRQQLDFITKGLSFRLKGSYNIYFSQNKVRNYSQPEYTPYYRTDVVDSAPGDSTVVLRKSGNKGTLQYNEFYGRDRDWALSARLKYNREFGPHSVNALALYRQRKNFYPAAYEGIPRGIVSGVGRANYNYDDRYFLQVSSGLSGSENFAPDQRYGLFPAVSGGWVLTNESFMDDIGFLDFLKLRASYGLVGNDQGIGRFLYLQDAYNASAGGYNFGDDVPQFQPGAGEGRLGNQEVTWETAAKQNYAVDLKLFGNKLDASFDYFREYRDDILTRRNTVPAYVSANLPAVNLGRVKNVGFEAEATWKQQLGDFFYSVGGNVSYAHNTILEQDEVARNEPYLRRTGHPVGQPFGYIFAGYFTKEDLQEGSDVPEHAYDAKPGDMKFKDLNGDGKITPDDQRPVGYPQTPEYSFGANMDFRYKGVDLSLVWAGATNVSRDLQLAPYRIPFGISGGFGLMKWQAEGRWTPEKGQDAEYPRFSLESRGRRNQYDSDFWVRDASYLRLKNAQLGYTLDGGFLKQAGLEKARVYVKGYNLLTFTGLDVIDPEQTGRPYQLQHPLMKVYTFGVNLNF